MNQTIAEVIKWNVTKINDPKTTDRDRARYQQNVKRLEELKNDDAA